MSAPQPETKTNAALADEKDNEDEKLPSIFYQVIIPVMTIDNRADLSTTTVSSPTERGHK